MFFLTLLRPVLLSSSRGSAHSQGFIALIIGSLLIMYFMAPADEFEKAEQDALITRILNESTTFHFWNGLTSALMPEPSSLAERLLNQYCLRCLDKL